MTFKIRIDFCGMMYFRSLSSGVSSSIIKYMYNCNGDFFSKYDAILCINNYDNSIRFYHSVAAPPFEYLS